VSIFEVGIGFSVFFKVGSVLGIDISKYRDIGIGIRYFSRLHYLKFVRSVVYVQVYLPPTVQRALFALICTIKKIIYIVRCDEWHRYSSLQVLLL